MYNVKDAVRVTMTFDHHTATVQCHKAHACHSVNVRGHHSAIISTFDLFTHFLYSSITGFRATFHRNISC